MTAQEWALITSAIELEKMVAKKQAGLYWFRLAHYHSTRNKQITRINALISDKKIRVRKSERKTMIAVRILEA